VRNWAHKTAMDDPEENPQPVKLTEHHSFFRYLANCTPMGRIQASVCFIFLALLAYKLGTENLFGSIWR
jgi:hypothetical protein